MEIRGISITISDYYLIFAVRKIGLPRGNANFIKTRNLKYFDKSKLISDLNRVDGLIFKMAMKSTKLGHFGK